MNKKFSFTIVLAEPKDADVLTQIAFRSKRHWGYPASWLNTWRPEIEITTQSIQSESVFKAIDQEGKILGFYRLSGKGKKLILSGFWVLPKYMKKGLGKALYLHMIEMARKLGASTIEWESDPNAAAFYIHMGAKQIGKKVYSLEGERRSLPILQARI